MKKYLLLWVNGNYRQHIIEGDKIKLIALRAAMKAEPQFKSGKMIIISEEGLKLKYGNKQTANTH